MKLLLVFALACASLSAMAECYEFNGYGPQKLGKAIFSQTPRTLCINETSRYSNVELSNKSERVAVIEATIRRERSPRGEIVADLGMATVNGLVEDYRGQSITIKRGESFNGAREVVIGNKSYSVSAK